MTHVRSARWLLGTAAALVAAGCGGGTKEPAPESWFQTTLGSVNTYLVTPPSGSPTSQTMTITASSSTAVTRKVLAAGSATYSLQVFALEPGGAVAQSAAGNYNVADDSFVAGSGTSWTPPALLIPADTAAGHVTTRTSAVVAGASSYNVTRTVTVVGMESVTVPAGTYSALKVTMEAVPDDPVGGVPQSSERWFVRGLGNVKTVTWPTGTPANAMTTVLSGTGGGGGGGVTTLASGLMNAAHVGADGTWVYWTESDDGANANDGSTTVKKVLVGGGAVTTLASTTGQPTYVGTACLRVDATSVYWVETNATAQSLRKVALGGGSVTTLATAPTYVPKNFAMDANNLYFSDFDAVRAVAKSGGAPWDLVTGLQEPSGIAADSTNVYWTSSWDGALRMAPKAGGSPTVLVASGVTTSYEPRVVASDGADVYFIGSTGDVMKVAVGGGTPATLAAGATASSIAMDGTNVYWTGNGVIGRVPKAGGAASTVAVTGSPWELALDPSNVYWVDGTSVRKLAKW